MPRREIVDQRAARRVSRHIWSSIAAADELCYRTRQDQNDTLRDSPSTAHAEQDHGAPGAAARSSRTVLLRHGRASARFSPSTERRPRRRPRRRTPRSDRTGTTAASGRCRRGRGARWSGWWARDTAALRCASAPRPNDHRGGDRAGVLGDPTGEERRRLRAAVGVDAVLAGQGCGRATRPRFSPLQSLDRTANEEAIAPAYPTIRPERNGGGFVPLSAWTRCSLVRSASPSCGLANRPRPTPFTNATGVRRTPRPTRSFRCRRPARRARPGPPGPGRLADHGAAGGRRRVSGRCRRAVRRSGLGARPGRGGSVGLPERVAGDGRGPARPACRDGWRVAGGRRVAAGRPVAATPAADRRRPGTANPKGPKGERRTSPRGRR